MSVTEEQRLRFLALLTYAKHDPDTVIKKAKELHGVDITKEQMADAINNLKKVRGV
jgi:hypothetical protein